MEFKVEDVSPISKRLEIDVDSETVAKELTLAVRQLSKKVRVPGFRPGKTPAGLIEKRFWGEIARQVEDTLIEASILEAVEKDEIAMVGTSSLQPGTLKRGESYSFSVEIEVRPEVEVSDYFGLEVNKPKVAVEEEEISNELNRMREQRKNFVPVEDRNVSETGDLLMLDYTFSDGDNEIASQEGVMIPAGQGHFLPDNDALVIGRDVPSEINETVDFPAEFSYKELAGKTVSVSISLKEIKKEELPELDDSFAEEAGEENLEALRGTITKRIADRKEEDARKILEENIGKALVTKHSFDVPQYMIRQRADHMIRSTYQQLQMMAPQMNFQLKPEDYGRMSIEYAPQAEQEVRSSLILNEIGKKEKIEVSEIELNEELERIATNSGQTVEKIRAEFQKEDAFKGLELMLQKKKTMDLLIEKATITELDMAEIEKLAKEEAEANKQLEEQNNDDSSAQAAEGSDEASSEQASDENAGDAKATE